MHIWTASTDIAKAENIEVETLINVTLNQKNLLSALIAEGIIRNFKHDKDCIILRNFRTFILYFTYTQMFQI